MAKRFYLAPMVSTGQTFPNPSIRPASIQEAGGVALRVVTYGNEPTALVMAEVTPAQHTAITQNTDIIASPQDIDSNLTVGAITTLQTALEAINIPGDGLTVNMTYRDALKIIGGIFFFAQRYFGLFGLRLFRGGVTLSTTFGSLPANERQRILDCSDSLNLDRSSLTGASTIRQILKVLGAQWRLLIMQVDEVSL